MNQDSYGIFLILLKLKFYLVSILDTPSVETDDFSYSEEYLERRYPDRKEQILSLIKEYGISSDSEIAFDEKIIIKFKEIASETEVHQDIAAILSKLEIESKALTSGSKEIFRNNREKEIHSLLELLFKLSTNWILHKELENKIDDYSILNEEEVIRPDEERRLFILDNNTAVSFNNLSDLSKSYVSGLCNYFFKHGGDAALKKFWQDMEALHISVRKKYSDLFKEHGLDLESME